MTFHETLNAVRSLNEEDRGRLYHAIVEEGLDGQIPFRDDEKAELRRRVADHRAHPQRAIPWEAIKADASARCKP